MCLGAGTGGVEAVDEKVSEFTYQFSMLTEKHWPVT